MPGLFCCLQKTVRSRWDFNRITFPLFLSTKDPSSQISIQLDEIEFCLPNFFVRLTESVANVVSSKDFSRLYCLFHDFRDEIIRLGIKQCGSGTRRLTIQFV